MTFAPSGRQTFNGLRGKEPVVKLTLAGSEVLYAERYTVKVSFLTQPARFSLTLGVPGNVAKTLAVVVPNTPFTLSINDRQVMTGALDTVAVSGTTGIIQVEGRDALAPLHDAYLKQEDTYKDDTYAQIVRKVMNTVGLKSVPLVYSNKVNRLAVVGLPSQPASGRNLETLKVDAGAGGSFGKHAQSKLGERAYEFIKRHLDRAGLFLMAGADGSYILTEPTVVQQYLYVVQRSDGAYDEFSDIEDSSLHNSTTERFSEVFVYTRGETKRKGRAKSIGHFQDNEMVDWQFDRPMVLRDENADTEAKAKFMARRLVAKSRREGYKLSYTMSGHVTGSAEGMTTGKDGQQQRALWYPDTLVRVDDARLGIADEFWIESVTYQSSPESKTVLDLMRREDLVFGEVPPPEPIVKPHPPFKTEDGIPVDVIL